MIRAWRDAAIGQARKLQLDKLAEGEAQAKAESARTKMMTVAEGRGATRRLRRISTEMWWTRLGQKIRAIATWARLVKGTTAIWYVNGKGRGLTAEVETAEGSDTAERNDTAAETEGRQRQMDGRRRGRAQTAMEGVKEGIRLWWWLEEGEGHNAKGPGSVTGRRRERTACPRRPP